MLLFTQFTTFYYLCTIEITDTCPSTMKEFKLITEFHEPNLPFPDGALHILCLQGTVSLLFRKEEIIVNSSEYAFFPHPQDISNLFTDNSFKGIILSYSSGFRSRLSAQSFHDDNIFLRIQARPIISLSSKEILHCKQSLININDRLKDDNHLFHRRLISSLLNAHILDLFHIYASQKEYAHLCKRCSNIMHSFLSLLKERDYIAHKNIGYYSSKLCMSDGAFTKNIKKASGHTPSYWIQQAINHDICLLLRDKKRTFSDIGSELGFSSSAHFSTYVKSNFGTTPSILRKNILART